MAVGDVPLTPIIDTVTGSVTEIGRIFLRTLTSAVGALAPIDATYWVSRGASVLTADVNLGALPSGYLKIASAVGIATPSTVSTIPPGDVTGLTAALALKADLASPAFTGTPTAPTAAPGTNTTQLATAAFARGEASAAIVGLAPLASPAFTGTPTAPTAAPGTNTTQLATTQFVAASFAPLASPPLTGTPTAPTAAPGTNTTQLATTQFVTAAIVPTAKLAGGNSFTGTQTMSGLVQVGTLLVNVASAIGNAQASIQTDGSVHPALGILNTNAGNTINFLGFFNSASAFIGSIGQNSATSVVYNTTSDARLKTDAGPATDLAALRAVVVHDFTWTADGIRDRGIFAQEAHAHFPRAITAGTDETTAGGALARPWQTDYSKFVPDLIVGWQQHDAAIAAIADLRAELAALRAQLEKGSDGAL